MGSSGIKKKAGAFLLALLMVLQAVVLPVPALAGQADGRTGDTEYEIYPVPQAVAYDGGTTELTEAVDVTYGDGVDSYTQKKTKKALEILGLSESEKSDAAHTKLTVGIYGKSDTASFNSQLGAEEFFTGVADGLASDKRFEKYILRIKDGQIVILGENADAAFRGVTTLQRVLEQVSSSDKKVRKMTVKDYAEVEYRGFIEGYYGNPWSHEDRADLMQYGGEIKMNQYVFAPKDDPYHRESWRALYPETGDKNSLVQIQELAKSGNENKCFYVYALHPFYSDKLKLATYDDDIAALKAKFEQVIDAGVRQIAILEDDGNAYDGSLGAGATDVEQGERAAEIVIKVLNDMTEWLEEKKDSDERFSDLKTDILFCPGFMAYSNNMNNSNSADVKKIQKIHAEVGENVRIVMTGGKIWGDVTTDFSDRFYQRMEEKTGTGRYPYLWVNWPCNDNTDDSLVMGGHNSILRPDLDGSKVHGIIFNPMQESEPSKVGLFTGADFCWNVWRGDGAQAHGDQAWRDSFKYIDHMSAIETESSQKLRDICQHMITQSDGQANNTGAKFEESLNIKEDLLAAQAKLENGDDLSEDEIAKVKQEMLVIRDNIKFYIKDKKGTNQRMASQLNLYASALSDMAEAAGYLMDAVTAIREGDSSAVYENFAKAQELYDRSDTYVFTILNKGGEKHAKGGRRYIIPFTSAALEYVSEEAKKVVDPEHIPLIEKLLIYLGGTRKDTNTADAEKTMDGDLSTVWEIGTKQIPGDYAGMTFNFPVEVRNIKIYMAHSGGTKNYIAQGVMEYTTDGKTWQAFETQPAIGGTDVEFDLPEPMQLRGFRLRCTEPLPEGEQALDRWLAIREIGYNIDGVPGEGEGPSEEKLEATFSRSQHWEVWGENDDSKVVDGDISTFAWYNPKGDGDCSMPGDYIQLDLGTVRTVGLVRALLGKDTAGDKWTQYHLEYSVTENDENPTAFATVTGSADGVYEADLQQAQARYIRLVNDVKSNGWVAFREFSAYPSSKQVGGPMDYTNVADEDAGWLAEYKEESARILAKENASLQPGEYIGLKLDRIHAIRSIETTGTGLDSLTLEKSVNEAEWTSETSGAARYIRLMNQTDAAVAFSLESLVASFDEVQPMHFEAASREPEGPYANQDARNTGTTGSWVDGNKNTSAKYCFEAADGDFVTYDLGQEVSLRALTLWVGKDAGDYPRNALVQAALQPDASEWETLFAIEGDGGGTGFDKKPADNGWNAGTGAIDVNYAYVGGDLDQEVKARYVRIYFNGENSGRYPGLSEIEVNHNEFLPTVNDPTCEVSENVVLKQGFEPKNMTDGSLITAFQPDGACSGSLIYHLSEDTDNIGRINILQNGNSISNAKVSVRTGADTWEEAGALSRSFNSYYMKDRDHVYAVKVEWEDAAPILYEIIALRGEGDVLDKNIKDASKQVSEAESQIAKRQEELDAATEQAAQAKAAMDAAADESVEKLCAETLYYEALAKQQKAEADLAELEATKADGQAQLLQAEAKSLRAQAKEAEGAEKEALIEQAQQKEEQVPALKETAVQQLEAAASKREELAQTEATAEEKREELGDQPMRYLVVFNSNGGSAIAAAGVVEGEKAEKPKNPTRSGYTFEGWYSDKELLNPYDFDTEVNAYITLYAKWTKNSTTPPPAVKYWTVSFNPNGAGVTGMPPALKNVKNGTRVVLTAKPTRAGYKFEGWSLSTSGSAVASLTVTKNVTLYAKWTKLPDPVKDGATMTDKKKKITYKIISEQKKTAMVVKGTNKKATSVKIPAEVTIEGVKCKVVTVGAGAFKGYNKMTKAEIGKNVTTIEKNAFSGCKKLKTVTLKGKALKTVKSKAFKGTAKSLTFKMPKGAKKSAKKKLQTTLRKSGNKKIVVK